MHIQLVKIVNVKSACIIYAAGMRPLVLKPPREQGYATTRNEKDYIWMAEEIENETVSEINK